MSSGSDESSKQTGGVFVQNNQEHHTFSLSRLLTAALALPLGSAFIAGILSYRSGISTVDERIENYKPLNTKLTTYEIKLEELDRKSTDHENRLRDIEYVQKARMKR